MNHRRERQREGTDPRDGEFQLIMNPRIRSDWVCQDESLAICNFKILTITREWDLRKDSNHVRELG
jgi:hypothetical protein